MTDHLRESVNSLDIILGESLGGGLLVIPHLKSCCQEHDQESDKFGTHHMVRDDHGGEDWEAVLGVQAKRKR